MINPTPRMVATAPEAADNIRRLTREVTVAVRLGDRADQMDPARAMAVGRVAATVAIRLPVQLATRRNRVALRMIVAAVVVVARAAGSAAIRAAIPPGDIPISRPMATGSAPARTAQQNIPRKARPALRGMFGFSRDDDYVEHSPGTHYQAMAQNSYAHTAAGGVVFVTGPDREEELGWTKISPWVSPRSCGTVERSSCWRSHRVM
jgi:hypothetical protein